MFGFALLLRPFAMNLQADAKVADELMAGKLLPGQMAVGRLGATPGLWHRLRLMARNTQTAIEHVDIAVPGVPTAFRRPSRPQDYEPMKTFDPTRDDVVVWDDLNHNEVHWKPEWAKQFGFEDWWDAEKIANNFDGLLLTGWRVAKK